MKHAGETQVWASTELIAEFRALAVGPSSRECLDRLLRCFLASARRAGELGVDPLVYLETTTGAYEAAQPPGVVG
jgi:hypothetical protein